MQSDKNVPFHQDNWRELTEVTVIGLSSVIATWKPVRRPGPDTATTLAHGTVEKPALDPVSKKNVVEMIPNAVSSY